ncbi:hypothetical protein ACIBCR_22055 [Micromonospora echinospora]|uniref:hypothetical protein n=1 Tax=Micromonospora echinospora TaxID=1877 RepID=UPI0037A7C364
MRLTVGPLSPAVYWRRRAVVLGAGILFLIVVLYSCSGSSDNTAGPERSPTPTPSTGDPAPSGSVLTPQSGEPPTSAGPDAPAGGGPDGGGPGGGGPATTSAAPPAPGGPVVPAGGAGGCTDAEISVTPVAAPTSVRSGRPVDLQLRIKNTSDRTCTRDVGADLQELFVKSGAEKVWSSDTCGTAKGSDVQSFTPGFERSYQVTWNGQDTTRCANGLADGPSVPAGTYQVFGRLDTKLSAPVKLTITNN